MRPRRKPLLVLLVKRAVLFLAVNCAVSLFLYAVGTSQDFLDETQVFLLRSTALLGLLSAIGAIYGCAVDLYAAVMMKSRRFLIGFAAYLLVAFCGLMVTMFSNALLVAVAGNIS